MWRPPPAHPSEGGATWSRRDCAAKGQARLQQPARRTPRAGPPPARCVAARCRGPQHAGRG
eukprot:9532166-Lingulodinium_polyedra.AAC.1